VGATGSFGAQLKALRETAGFTQEELATIAGVSVHAVSALERGRRRRPHVDTVRALSAALDLTGPTRDAFFASGRSRSHVTPSDEMGGAALPLALTRLVGRDPDLQTLQQWMADPAARLITLTGPGGVGKTRLAIEVARRIADEGASRVTFTALASIRDPELVACAIAEALGLADISALDLANRVRAACDRRPTLLLLDNFEQVLAAAAIVANLLTVTTTLRLLVTSRARLGVRGEREYPVEPLAADADSDSLPTEDVPRSPAVQLFVERVRDVQPDFRLTSANGRTVAAICRRLDALPLALELAAPWIKALTVQDVLRRLEHDVLFSVAAPDPVAERQQTMTATIAWSYQLLDENERRVFRRLGVLPGRFPLEAAEAVAGGRTGLLTTTTVLNVVASLIDRSLVLRAETSSPTRPLYRMLETVRAFAAHELAAEREREDALEGLVRYCLAEAPLAAAGLVGPLQARWLDRVREDLESYRSAMTCLLGCGRSSETSAIACSLVFFWMIRGHAAEGLGWYERILAQPALTTEIESGAIVCAALMTYMQGESGGDPAKLERALTLARAADDLSVVAPIESMLGHIEHARGNVGAACDRFARGIDAYRRLALPWGVGSALSGLGGAVLAAGDTAQAERLFEEATTVLQDAGPWFLSPVRCFRAVLAVQRGDADDAIVLLHESLLQIRELQDKYAFVYALLPLANAAILKGDHLWAARILGARDAVAERTGVAIAVGLLSELQKRTEREARARLGDDRWARAYAAGRSVSIDSLLKEIEARVLTSRARPA
jgi:predicted ATPase/DNA-binding XRE family transcriptional regulator